MSQCSRIGKTAFPLCSFHLRQPPAHIAHGFWRSPFPHSPLALPIWTTFALSPLRPSQPLRLLIHLPVVHLTPGAHIVWVRGQMHEGHPSGSNKRRGCEGRVRSHDRSRQTDEEDPVDQKRTRVAPRGSPSTPRGVGRNPSLTASLTAQIAVRSAGEASAKSPNFNASDSAGGSVRLERQRRANEAARSSASCACGVHPTVHPTRDFQGN